MPLVFLPSPFIFAHRIAPCGTRDALDFLVGQNLPSLAVFWQSRACETQTKRAFHEGLILQPHRDKLKPRVFHTKSSGFPSCHSLLAHRCRFWTTVRPIRSSPKPINAVSMNTAHTRHPNHIDCASTLLPHLPHAGDDPSTTTTYFIHQPPTTRTTQPVLCHPLASCQP